MVTTHTSIFHTQKHYSRNALMCFGWSPQQSEVISLHRIGQLVFTNGRSVCCAVRTEYLHKIQVKFNLQWVKHVYVGKYYFRWTKTTKPIFLNTQVR